MTQLLTCGSTVLLYLALCAIGVVAGRGCVRLLRLGVSERAGLLLGPVLTGLYWTLVLGVTIGYCVPTKLVAPWLWGTTAILGLNGMRRPWPAWRDAAPLLLAVVLPGAVLTTYFWEGAADYMGCCHNDGFCYVAGAQYFWEFPRFTEGGLAPLYQFGSHLSVTRYITFGLLGFLSPLVHAGDTQAVCGVYQCWLLFNMSCAVALFWVALRQKPWVLLTGTTLTIVAGWMVHMHCTFGNFDQGLALGYMPALAAVIRLSDLCSKRWWFLMGLFLAGIVYSYAETSPFMVAAAAILTVPSLGRNRRLWLGWLGGWGLCLVVAACLLFPGAGTLVRFFKQQLATAQLPTRAGNDVFPGLLEGKTQLPAYWGLGSERTESARYAGVRMVIAWLLTTLLVVGLAVMLRHGMGDIAVILVLLVLASLYFLIHERFTYGVYKVIVVNWWCMIAGVVVGANWLLQHLRQPLWHRAAAACLILVALCLVGQAKRTQSKMRLQQGWGCSPIYPWKMSELRSVNEIQTIVGDEPVLVNLDNGLVSDWTAYYLRTSHICFGAHKDILGLAFLQPLMKRAWSTPLDRVTLFLMDAPYDDLGNGQGWKLLWSSGPYRLWQGHWLTPNTQPFPPAPAVSRSRKTAWLPRSQSCCLRQPCS